MKCRARLPKCGARLCRRVARAVALATLVCAACGAARAQEESATQPARPKLEVATQLDEFGRLSWCDHSARLDNLAGELSHDPTLRGYIIGYPGSKEQAADFTRLWLAGEKDYLVNSRGIVESRIVTLVGGARAGDKPTFALWVVPEGAPAPEPSPAASVDARAERTGKLHTLWLDESSPWPCGEVEGFCLTMMTLRELAARLDADAMLSGYMVAYAAPDSAPGAWRRLAKLAHGWLAEAHPAAAARVTLLSGGAAAESRVELWVLPKDAAPPVAAAPAEKPLTAALKLNSFADYQLEDAGLARWARENVADMLREDKRARAVIVIHPPKPEPQEGDAEEAELAPAAEPSVEADAVEPTASATPASGPPANADATDAVAADAPAEPPPVSLEQRAEELRQTLAKELGGAVERVEVVCGRLDSLTGGTLDVWIVPHGAAPPDPFAPEPEEEQPAAGDDANENDPPPPARAEPKAVAPRPAEVENVWAAHAAAEQTVAGKSFERRERWQ
ncbi:MAG TPA: hypothetical protein VF546_07015 [Pyrinomonadaceae bacterium]|jgi:hypothetical protein